MNAALAVISDGLNIASEDAVIVISWGLGAADVEIGKARLSDRPSVLAASAKKEFFMFPTVRRIRERVANDL